VPPIDPIEYDGGRLDLSRRFKQTSTVVASPAASTETIIASLTITENIQATLGVFLWGFAAWTVGTSGDGVNLKLHATDASGTTIKASGLITSTATNLDARSIVGLATSPTIPGQVYVLTMTVHGGAAESTVSAVTLMALVV
jgi:hypothetical protein